MRKTLTLIVLFISIACFGQKKWSEYPNRPYVTNGGWLILYADPSVTNYNQSFNQHTQQLWQAILGPTNYGTTTLIGGLATTNIVLASTGNQTNYTLSVTNAIEQEIYTANTNVNLTVAADRIGAQSLLWVNALTSSISATVRVVTAGCRTNLGFISTVTNGTARAYSVEWRKGLAATNLWVIHKETIQ